MSGRSLVPAIVLVVFSAAAGLSLFYYRYELGRNVAWHKSVEVERESRLPTTVFELAREAGFLKAIKGPNGELFIEPPPCERMLLKSTPAEKSRMTALTILCTSQQGEEIRQEVDGWNASYDLVAVRDNKSQNEKCEREPLNAEIFVPRNCKPNTWKSERLVQGRAVTANWIPNAEPPPDEFSMLVDPDDPTRYSGDWAMLRSERAFSGERPRYRLSNSIVVPAGESGVTISLAGRLRRVSIGSSDSAGHVVAPEKPETPPNGILFGNRRVRIAVYCGSIPEILSDDIDEDDEKTVEECNREPAAELRTPVAYQVRVTIDPGTVRGKKAAMPEDRTTAVFLEAEPVENLPKNLRVRSRSDRFVVARTRHLRATCPNAFHDADGTCELAWARVPGAEQSVPREFRILSDKDSKDDPDENLVDPATGVIAPKAFDQGFGPVIGLGPQDWGSLISSVARERVPRTPDGKPAAARTVRVTIDRRIQRIADQVIRSARDCQGRRSVQLGKRKKQRVPDCSTRLRKDQSAALIVLDAGDRAGEIRAIAGSPTMPRHLHLWDLQAMEHLESAYGGMGWRLISGHQRPGSSFKPITALAAIEATRISGNTELASLLSGRLGAPDHAKILRLANNASKKTISCLIGGGALNTIPVPSARQPSWCARNFGWGDYWRPANPQDTGCPTEGATRSQFGMCEALMISSNLFFGGISWRLTDRSLNAPAPDMTISRVAHRLTFGGIPKENPGSEATGIDRFDLTRGTMRSVPKLSADPIQFDLKNHGEALSNLPRLIRTGFGDGAAATPLAMATAYASIARGRIVRPSIVPLARDAAGCPTTGKTELECETLLPDWTRVERLFPSVKAGLHAVATAGTARSTFASEQSLLKMPDGKPRLYVKTGTATTSTRPLLFGLWLVGWIEGVKGTGIPSTLAFACVITRGRGLETGGGTCAPLMRMFLSELSKQGAT
jgi:cell division protein FtsI/penicillin-binding protein 2